MAQLFTNSDKTINFNNSLIEGDLKYLDILKNNLSDDFEIYLQPFINGDCPKIIILRKNVGVFILEVKNWIFNDYIIDNHDIWKLKENNLIIESPINQVQNYKRNLYNLHIDGLLEGKIQNKKLFSLIKIGVYFHKETINSINTFIQKKYNYIELYGYDSIKNINDNIFKNYSKNIFFTEKLYNKFKSFLQPFYHKIEQGKEINYTNKQQELFFSKENKQQKIKGVAGSGKTLVLVKRAINANIRTNKKVLILTYNITLKNYIHNKLSEVRENFNWNDFYIDNYHNFIKSQTNNLNINIKDIIEYDNLNLFENKKLNIEKYEAIFIDEIQDYKTEWINIIKKYFLSINGEFVVFGDEKQNIYNRKLDSEHKPNTTIPGRWAELNESFRLSDKIAKVASRFQKEYFSEKYDINNINIVEQTSLFSDENIEYLKFTKKISINKLTNKIFEILKNKNINSNDICILSSKIALLRSIDSEIRIGKEKNTKTTFETKEIFEKLKKESKNLDLALKEVRKNKKFNFYMNRETYKLSTIHSFKGWEIPTLFLIIDSKENNDELIYTAITRCRFNLFIINIDNERYDKFFIKNNDIINFSLQNKILVERNEEKITLKTIKETKIEETIEDIETEELNITISFILNQNKGNCNKFKIGIIGEIARNKEDFENEIGSFFNKYNVKVNSWEVEFINNRKLKSKNLLKSFRKGQSSYSLLITGQLYKHSSSGNEDANLLEELKKTKYIYNIVGSSPKDKLTINNLLEKLDKYLNEKVKEYRL